MLLLETDDFLKATEGLLRRDALVPVRVQLVPEEDELSARVLADRLPPEAPSMDIRNDDQTFLFSPFFHLY